MKHIFVRSSAMGQYDDFMKFVQANSFSLIKELIHVKKNHENFLVRIGVTS